MHLLDIYLLVLLYLIIASGILLFSRHRQQDHWKHYLLANGIIILTGTGLFLLKTHYFLISLFADWAPLLLILFFYQEAGLLSRACWQGTFDNAIIRFETKLFAGKHPCIWLSETFNSYYLSEFLHLCYLSYFLLLYSVPLYFYLTHQYTLFYQCMFAELLLQLSSFLTHSIVPVLSPRTIFKKISPPLSNGLIYRFTHRIVASGSAQGTAFPSTHVGIATLVLLITWHAHTGLFYYLLPFSIGLIIATVYGRFHYVIDAMFGILYASVVFRVVY